VSDQTNEFERLTSEVASLKLELATLTSAIRELQHQQAGQRMTLPAKARAHDRGRPSMTPAAIVVLIGAGLLSWQVITTPSANRLKAQANRPAPTAPRADDRQARLTIPASIEPAATTEPPPAPIVKPTIYRGTLTVKADRPGARVFVNRKAVGTAPVRVGNLRAGSHLVWVESEGYRRWTRVVTVPSETVTRVAVDFEPEPIVER
jgi:hypothetical protein